jgi:hypothetical protein
MDIRIIIEVGAERLRTNAMSKKRSTTHNVTALSHDREDGFDFLCNLEQKDNYHGDKNLEKSCQELRAALRRKK